MKSKCYVSFIFYPWLYAYSTNLTAVPYAITSAAPCMTALEA